MTTFRNKTWNHNIRPGKYEANSALVNLHAGQHIWVSMKQWQCGIHMWILVQLEEHRSSCLTCLVDINSIGTRNGEIGSEEERSGENVEW